MARWRDEQGARREERGERKEEREERMRKLNLNIFSSILQHFPRNALVCSFIFPGTNGQVTPILFFPHAEKQ